MTPTRQSHLLLRITHCTRITPQTSHTPTACLNPATSHVIREWDQRGAHDYAVRAELAEYFRGERDSRRIRKVPAQQVRELVEV